MRVDTIPIWVVFIGTIVAVMIALEVGYRLGQTFHRRSEDELDASSPSQFHFS